MGWKQQQQQEKNKQKKWRNSESSRSVKKQNNIMKRRRLCVRWCHLHITKIQKYIGNSCVFYCWNVENNVYCLMINYTSVFFVFFFFVWNSIRSWWKFHHRFHSKYYCFLNFFHSFFFFFPFDFTPFFSQLKVLYHNLKEKRQRDFERFRFQRHINSEANFCEWKHKTNSM